MALRMTRGFLRSRLTLAGAVVLGLIALFSFIGPLLSPYGEYTVFYHVQGEELINPSHEQIAHEQVRVLVRAKSSARHWLGTDQEGRDILTRLMYGGRISLAIGICAMMIELFIGILIGALAGCGPRWLDILCMRVVDAFRAIPPLPVILAVSSVMLTVQIGHIYRMIALMLALGLLGWADIARMVRGQVHVLQALPYMRAAQMMGMGSLKQFSRHLLPNFLPQLIVMAASGVGQVILLESTLSFLGFGLPFPYASWGNMMNAASNMNILTQYPHIWLPAGICIAFTVIGFNLLSDGLQSAMNPQATKETSLWG